MPPFPHQEFPLNWRNLIAQTKGLYSGVQRAEGCYFSYLIHMLLLKQIKIRACIQLSSSIQILLQTLYWLNMAMPEIPLQCLLKENINVKNKYLHDK